MTRKSLEATLLARINKLGSASGTIPFFGDPLWLSNPEEMISVYWYKSNISFWKYKFYAGVLTCIVVGSWCIDAYCLLLGGIRGKILE